MRISPDTIPNELIAVLRQCCPQMPTSACLALGGSHAKSRGDQHSDIDLYIFSSDVFSVQERTDLVRETLAGVSEVVSWGDNRPFVQAGTDFCYANQRVECWFRSTEHVQKTIAACQAGDIRREYTGWTVMGFFNYVLLSDITSMRVIDDPSGLLARWKSSIRSYPEPLRRAILKRFMREALFWPENPHYRSALERLDLIYVRGIVQHVLHALIQVVFALNREYFPGEKKLASVLTPLKVQPPNFVSRVEAVLGWTMATSDDLFAQQRYLAELVSEVAQLERIHGAA